VPIRPFLEHKHWFNPEEIAKMSAAFEAASAKLGLVHRSDPATMAVAKLIIEFESRRTRSRAPVWLGGAATIKVSWPRNLRRGRGVF
jgi:hypothetical protein